ncbi:glycine/sarcosine/betaine reductase selenoprotein B family protein [Pseudalkalibacillus sp. A8]|uniref:glycine/sarcosine/betaine reductase selenoprotein B family protein n=1 Tax=Pseudalkalibacillus sp. A8 TaxID=3382641 RepID=UPI0038B5ACA6
MSWHHKLKGKMVVLLAKAMPSVYNRFTLKLTENKEDKVAASLDKPLSEARVTLITSAGVHLKKDEPFDALSDGDYSYRVIPADTEVEELEVTHIYYDTKQAKVDKTIVFPLPQLRDLAAQGKIGSVSNVNIGLNGGTLKPERHEKETAPLVVDLLKDDQVNIALLVPG